MDKELYLEEIIRKTEENAKRIDENLEKIKQNTGAVEILKTFKADSQRFFIMWLITFVTLMCSLCVIIFLLHR